MIHPNTSPSISNGRRSPHLPRPFLRSCSPCYDDGRLFSHSSPMTSLHPAHSGCTPFLSYLSISTLTLHCSFAASASQLRATGHASSRCSVIAHSFLATLTWKCIRPCTVLFVCRSISPINHRSVYQFVRQLA